jgi:hypothetical protein
VQIYVNEFDLGTNFLGVVRVLGSMSYTPQVGEVNCEPSTAKQVGAVTPQSSFRLSEYPVSGVA